MIGIVSLAHYSHGYYGRVVVDLSRAHVSKLRLEYVFILEAPHFVGEVPRGQASESPTPS
jgi:hypothetical protein